MICVLMVASGAAWESSVLADFGQDRDIVVLKRCVDVADLLAAAAAGQADVAVVALDAPGLDLPAIEHLRRHQVRPVAIVADGSAAQHDAARARAERLGLRSLVAESELAGLAGVVRTPEPDTRPAASSDLPAPEFSIVELPGAPASPPVPRRVRAIWGPAGAPGRSTIAAGVAAELAARGLRTVLIDADPWGGAIAQQLGILDEASGLLAAARLSTGGGLAERFASVQRGVNEQLSVVTGLPRPDRWVEVRQGVVEHLVEVARETGQVVVDVGFSLEDDPASEFGSRPGRTTMTLDALGVADEIVAVGQADPVGLARLARGLVDLRELQPEVPVRVVINRMRPGLGWSEKQVAATVEEFARVSGVHFLPEDRAGADRALMAGRTLIEIGDSALGRAMAGLVDVVAPEAAPRPVRRRRAGTARRR